MKTILALAALVLIVVLSGCVSTGPRFPAEVQQSLAERDMRRMETENLKIYYPEQRREEAHHIATRLEGCLADLEEKTPRSTDWGLVPIFLPETEFNNAYVAFGPGEHPHIVLPTFFTANIFGDFGYTPSVAAVGCHEMVHYVHLTQIHNFYGLVNDVFGPSINPQVGLDLWFIEGLATYYESQLVDGVGRYGSPIWENIFAAGVADLHLDGGRLSQWDRSIPFGAHYLIGSQFVAYLADTYGEERLWDLIDRQGSSVLFPFGVSLRFRAVYGKTLSDLIDDFAHDVDERFEARTRSPHQKRQKWVGRTAILESGPNGKTAIYSADVDDVASIDIFDKAGQRLTRQRIPDVLPGRQIVAARGLEAMRFSPDGEALYFLVNHQGRNAARTDLMRLDIDGGDVDTVHGDLEAVGWDLTPDAEAINLAIADGNRTRIERLAVDSDRREELFTLPAGAYLAWLRTSPDGQRLAATLMEDDQWSIAVFDIDGGQLVGRWSTEKSHRPALDPYWLDDERLLFVASDNDRIEIFEADLSDGSVQRHSDVPYMAFNPRPADNGEIQFLNREDWGWTLDRIANNGGEATDTLQFRGGHTEAEVVGYEAAERPAQILDDSPYSQLDNLFVPRLRVPELLIIDGGEEIYAGLGISGRDELGFHNWAIDAQWDFAEERLSGSFAYVNTQLSPWQWTLQIANRWGTTTVLTGDDLLPTEDLTQRDRFAVATLSRVFYDIPVWLEFLAADFFREGLSDEADDIRRLLGPEVGARYRAGRSTPYGGTQWLFALSGLAAGYPAELGSDFSMAHLRAQLELGTPLPLSARHRMRFSGRVRALPGVPDDEPLMRVGGFGPIEPVFVSGDAEDEPRDGSLLPRVFLFSESLRGYEDLGLVSNRVAIGDINYRYPIIVDRGTASTLTIFPASFIREFGIEAFGSAATLMEGDIHAAVGASADVSMMIWAIPLQLRYQVAQRLFDDEALVQSIVVGAGVGF